MFKLVRLPRDKQIRRLFRLAIAIFVGLTVVYFSLLFLPTREQELAKFAEHDIHIYLNRFRDSIPRFKDGEKGSPPKTLQQMIDKGYMTNPPMSCEVDLILKHGLIAIARPKMKHARIFFVLEDGTVLPDD